ncbi:MAG: ester cyclase [Candidatus Dormibacteraeota bacterium]|nr:ester cyclase [Candidatus Dormibacteraeota bacterium]
MADLKEKTRNAIELFNQHRIDEWLKDFTEDAELVTPLAGRLKGRDAISAYYSRMYETYPDIKVTVRRIVNEGRVVVVEYTVTGTNSGPLTLPTGDVLPATNKKVEVPAVDVATNDANDRITSIHQYFDAASALQQLGLMPAPAAARA